MRLRPLWLPLLLLAGCHSPATALQVQVYADNTVQARLRAVRVQVYAPSGTLRDEQTFAVGSASGQFTLPVEFTVQAVNDPLTEQVEVDVSGLDTGGTSFVQARVIVTGFVASRTQVAPIWLWGACVNTMCAAGETCGPNGVCTSAMVTPSSLPSTGMDASCMAGSVSTINGCVLLSDAGADSSVDASPADAGAAGPPRSCPIAGTPGCGFVAIPGGSFVMGEADGVSVQDTPVQSSITVSAFTLDAYEVTVGRFRQFWNAGHPAPVGMIAYPGGAIAWGGPVTEPLTTAQDGNAAWTAAVGPLETHPINDVNWYTAQAFCVWDGGRLPTEAEWEWAARGWTAGSTLASERNYPWGAPDPSTTCDRAEWNNCPGDDGTVTRHVGSFAASGGLYDLAGNVWEWTADWLAPYTDTTCWNNAARTDPMCANDASGHRVIRGGSWDYGDLASVHSASRYDDAPMFLDNDLGFRCARSL